MNVIGGTTDVTTYFVLRTAADGTATTGATIADIDLQYIRTGALPSAKADAIALAAVDSAHADNRAIEVDATDAPGLYRVDWPDAAFAAGVRQVVLTIKLAGSFTEHMAVEIDPPVGVAASVTGNVGGNVAGSVANVVGNLGGNVLGSIAGSVAAVTGNVGGNVLGSVASIGAGGIVAATFGANAINAAALAASAANEIRDAVFAKTGITAVGTVSFSDIINIIYALLRGNVTRVGNVYPFKDDDDATTVVTLTIVDPNRTVS